MDGEAEPVGEKLKLLEALIAAVNETVPVPPVTVVVDTLARCMEGGDENDTRHMGEFVAGCDRIARAFECLVLVVHHPNKSGESERGSTALRARDQTRISSRSAVTKVAWASAPMRSVATA